MDRRNSHFRGKRIRDSKRLRMFGHEGSERWTHVWQVPYEGFIRKSVFRCLWGILTSTALHIQCLHRQVGSVASGERGIPARMSRSALSLGKSGIFESNCTPTTWGGRAWTSSTTNVQIGLPDEVSTSLTTNLLTFASELTLGFFGDRKKAVWTLIEFSFVAFRDKYAM